MKANQELVELIIEALYENPMCWQYRSLNTELQYNSGKYYVDNTEQDIAPRRRKIHAKITLRIANGFLGLRVSEPMALRFRFMDKIKVYLAVRDCMNLVNIHQLKANLRFHDE